jgi:lipopolysaccharide transport system ATP-binding protein
MLFNEVVIKTRNIKKRFKRTNSTRVKLKQLLHYLFDKESEFDNSDDFYALNDISFDVFKGETVGIVGKNGSGKSTLLQIICGTLNQTSGKLEVNGRIAALLELGSGFNPNFTGRENVYMNASILGVPKKEIDEKFDDIVSFSEIGDFIDQPVKTYSSGMLVRLAFSVAISIEPEILVVDEALAVGDELFQRKCYSKIDNLKRNGATVLFVSHDARAVVELCDRAILINDGCMLGIGKPKSIIAFYQKLIYAPIDVKDELVDEIKDHFSKNIKSDEEEVELQLNDFNVYDPSLKALATLCYPICGAEIIEPNIYDSSGNKVNILNSRSRYIYKFDVIFRENLTNVRFSMVIKTATGLSLGGTFTHPLKNSIPLVSKGSKLTAEFEFDCLLNTGTYFINAGAYSDDGDVEKVIHRIVDAVAFRVTPTPSALLTEIIDFNYKVGFYTNG